jgi:hypothetical protein
MSDATITVTAKAVIPAAATAAVAILAIKSYV